MKVVTKCVNGRAIRILGNLVLACTLMLVCRHAFAAEGTDLLAGTETDLIATIKGTGKKFLYAAELIIATYGFVKTRQPSVFMGILALSVGFNILLKIVMGV